MRTRSRKHRNTVTTKQTLTLLGSLFELGGVAAVVIGISQDRRRFTRRPGLWWTVAQGARSVVRKLLRKPGRVISLEVSDVLSVASGLAEAEVIPGWPAGLEGQLQWLRDRIAAEREYAGGQVNKIGQRITELRSDLEARTNKVAIAVQDLSEHFEKYVSANLRPQAWGAASVVTGLVITSWASLLPTS